MGRFGWPIDYGSASTAMRCGSYDEVQLMGAGIATSAQLEAFRRGGRNWRRDVPCPKPMEIRDTRSRLA